MKDIFKLGDKETVQEVANTSPAIDLDAMSNVEVNKLIAECNRLLKKRERQHKKQIQAQIKKMATDAGITVSFSKNAMRKSPASKSG